MLVAQWLQELHELEDFTQGSIEQWATAENLGIKDFDYRHAANFYPFIYQRRYRDYKEQGYAFLEKAMEGGEPSFGYSVLAQLMATTQHKAAITTNFDNLIADALSIYTRVFPLVCGHESLTGYIREKLRRPLIAKIHRDLLLAPLNSPDEIAALPEDWNAALSRIFASFTPIVIGYGGNDGSLMGFLNSVAPIAGGIFWCHRASSDVDTRVHEVVTKHLGKRVPIAGFDEFMLQLQEKLGLPALLPQLEDAHKHRVADYQKQVEKLTATLAKPAENPLAEAIREPARQAAKVAVSRLTREKGWWGWQLKANAEPDPAKRDAFYRAGLQDFPDSVELLGNYANFLCDERKDYDAAESLYKRAIEADPKNGNNLANVAGLLLARGKSDALPALECAFAVLNEDRLFPAELECWFYLYANGAAERRAEALRHIRQLLASAIRSPNWDLSMNIVRARSVGHPEAGWLERLAAVINDVATTDTLDTWPAWNDAGA